jgi:hypothetical protein
MNHKSPRAKTALVAALATAAFLLSAGQQAAAVSFNLKDDFEGGTTLGWTGSTTSNVADAGPAGAGDNALLVEAGNRIVVYNTAQWTGNYTAAGITHLAMDLRNTAAFPLQLRIGIANGNFAPNGDGDTYVSNDDNDITVANDGAWHHIVFDVGPSAFSPSTFNSNSAPSAAAALAALTHLRILHNPTAGDFRGAQVPAEFYLDNIQAIPEPTGGALAALAATALVARRRLRRC